MSGGLGPLLRALANRAGAPPLVEEIRSTPWASITFSGMRHRLALRFAGEAAEARADAMTRGLDYAEFDLGRHLLVDIAVAERERDEGGTRLVIEALTVEQD